MRHIYALLVAIAVVVVTPASLFANASLSYDNGVVLDFPDADLSVKLNFRGQANYRYINLDGLEDVSDFDIRRARIKVTANALGGDVTFKLQNDFTGDLDDGAATFQRTEDLKDLWVQYNAADAAKIRLGQYKLPFSLQASLSSFNMQFIDRSVATILLAHGRSAGLMVHGDAGGLYYAVSVDNGSGLGEGTNAGGFDTDHRLVSMVSLSSDGYNRKDEGDIAHEASTDWTAGISSSWEDAEVLGDGLEVEIFRLAADVGFKCHGLAAQGEFFYRQIDVDGLSSSADDIGFYVQSGYAFVPDAWDVAARFSAVFNDDDVIAAGDVEDRFEYNLAIGHYLMGHDLKVQAQVSFDSFEFYPDGDADDFRAELQASVEI